eukprot:5509480-Prymnesium_polylepis.1
MEPKSGPARQYVQKLMPQGVHPACNGVEQEPGYEQQQQDIKFDRSTTGTIHMFGGAAIDANSS